MASAGMDTIRFHCGSEATSGPTINAVPGDDRETQTLGGSLTFLRRFRGAVPPARDAARTETWGDVESAGERSLLGISWVTAPRNARSQRLLSGSPAVKWPNLTTLPTLATLLAAPTVPTLPSSRAPPDSIWWVLGALPPLPIPQT